MARFRMYPTGEQEQRMLLHCAHARYVWNLAVEQHAHWQPGRKAAPALAEQCRQLTEARRENEWLGAGNADVQQQALKDFAKAKSARFTSGFGEPTWRRKHVHEGFRVIGTDRVPEYRPDGTPKLNAKTGRQVMGRSVVVGKLNRRWARVKVPGCGWVRFAAGQGGIPRPRRTAGAGGTTPPTRSKSVREPQPAWAGIPPSKRGRMSRDADADREPAAHREHHLLTQAGSAPSVGWRPRRERAAAKVMKTMACSSVPVATPRTAAKR